MASGENNVTRCPRKFPTSPKPFRRVSSLQPVKRPVSTTIMCNQKATSLTSLLDEQSRLARKLKTDALGQVMKVRFTIDAIEDSQSDTLLSKKCIQDNDPLKNRTKPGRSSFKDKFRSSFQRKNKSAKKDAHTNGIVKQDGMLTSAPMIADSYTNVSTTPQNLSGLSINESESAGTEDSHLWDRFNTQQQNYRFQRSHSTKSRVKIVTENCDDEVREVAHSVTDGSFLYRSSSFMLRHLHFLAAPQNWFNGHKQNVTNKEGYSFSELDHQSLASNGYHGQNYPGNGNCHAENKAHNHHSNRPKPHLSEILGNIFGHGRAGRSHGKNGRSHRKNSIAHRSTPHSLTGHSLASVELGTWAARGSRSSTSLPPFCASLSPTEASSRGEILQTVSSSIIHLFQKKPLKENELGVLQEHVRFLIRSEAGSLVHEYYKDQLLRKGMIILREKIKNEQGLELLKLLCETWEYFFKEILPILQAILYPLIDLLVEDETIRSLSLLAFRNIVVLKVSVKEALDSVEKHNYPANIQQMFLVLQSIQDNVFLSENQFLLEKLVARVVCPYLGQRGVYEGSPDPVIKVKLKPIPIIIPSNVASDNRFPFKPHLKIDHPVFPSPVPSWKGHQDISSIKKLKPVLEHVYEVGRRHSIIS